jgi:DNA-binding SARP family transcriptional activator
VDVLGTLRVCRDSVPVDLGSVKQHAIFAILVLRQGETVSMTELESTLWAGCAPDAARQIIHTYIARLRRSLEPNKPPRRRSSIIVSAPFGYRLSTDHLSTDLARFETLASRACLRNAAGAGREAFQLYENALGSWRDPALADLSALLHGLPEVENLRCAWLECALRYVELGAELSLESVVLPVAERLARADPLHEEAQARYLGILARTGRRAAAMRRFSEVRDRLHSELGVEPGPQLAAVGRLLLPDTSLSEDRKTFHVYGARPAWS